MTSHQKVYKRLPELLYEVKSSLATKDFFHMYAVRVSQPRSYAPPSFLSFAVKRSVYIYIVAQELKSSQMYGYTYFHKNRVQI